MSDDFKVQISYKLGPNLSDMLNVRAQDGLELGVLLETLREEFDGERTLIQDIVEVGTLLRASGAAGPLLGQPAAASGVPAAAAPVTAPGGSKQCAHGEMTYREGQSARGPWKGYFCPTPKGTPGQCKAEFIR